MAPEPQTEAQEAPEPPPAPEVEHAPWEGEDEFPEAPAAPPAEFADAKLLGEVPPNDHFRIFGYDRENIWHWVKREGVVRCTGRTQWNKQSFMALAPLDWWSKGLMTTKAGSIDLDQAFEHVHGLAQKAGYFTPSRLRGRGAWRDGDRTIYHLGDRLLVDGEVHDLDLPGTQFIYDRGVRLPMPAAETLSDDDGRRVVAMAERFSWATPASALLIAGWCALAPVCGALRWRPHVWITGGAGSGKSTILDGYVQFLLNDVSVFAQGNSTEAGIRQELGCDALPVLLDEAEQNNEREQFKIQNILSNVRQSSSEVAGRVLKGTVSGKAMYFQVRSMFCFCSIQVGLTQQADMERIAILSLRPKRGSGDAWPHIRDGLASLRADEGLPSRLFRRALDLLPTTLKNIEVFGAVAAKRFGAQRHGDQFGTLLAGAWSLMSREVATPDQALKLIEAYDWTGYLESTETEESEKALNALLGRSIELPKGKATVHEVITRAAGRDADCLDLGVKDANAVLKRNGMMVRDGRLFISNTSHALKKLMAETAYGADLRGQLLRVPGVEKHDVNERFGGERTKAVKVPLATILDGGEPAPAEVNEEMHLGLDARMSSRSAAAPLDFARA